MYYGLEVRFFWPLALPAKPINFIPLSDADPESSLSFVMQKLLDRGIDVEIFAGQTAYVERLGGRASDLESVSPRISLFLLSSITDQPCS